MRKISNLPVAFFANERIRFAQLLEINVGIDGLLGASNDVFSEPFKRQVDESTVAKRTKHFDLLILGLDGLRILILVAILVMLAQSFARLGVDAAIRASEDAEGLAKGHFVAHIILDLGFGVKAPLAIRTNVRIVLLKLREIDNGVLGFIYAI